MLVYQGKSTIIYVCCPVFSSRSQKQHGELGQPNWSQDRQSTRHKHGLMVSTHPHPLRTNGETWGGFLWLKLLTVTSCSLSSDASIPSSANCVHRNGVWTDSNCSAMGGGPQISSEKKWCFTIRKRDHCRFVWSCLMVYHGSSSLSLFYVKHILRWIINWWEPRATPRIAMFSRWECLSCDEWPVPEQSEPHWTLNAKKTTTPKNLMIYHHQFPQDYSFRLFMDIRNFGETQMFIKVFPLKLSLADEFVTIALKRPARAACLQNIATRGILSLCLFSDCWFYHCSTMF